MREKNPRKTFKAAMLHTICRNLSTLRFHPSYSSAIANPICCPEEMGPYIDVNYLGGQTPVRPAVRNLDTRERSCIPRHSVRRSHLRNSLHRLRNNTGPLLASTRAHPKSKRCQRKASGHKYAKWNPVAQPRDS